MEHVSWQWTLKIWWSFFWRLSIIGLISGIVGAAAIGAVLNVFGRSDLIAMTVTPFSAVVIISVSLWALRSALLKNIDHI
jgi:hypothetical protein